MPSFKGNVQRQADRRRHRLRRQGDRRQPERLITPCGLPPRRPRRRDGLRPHARLGGRDAAAAHDRGAAPRPRRRPARDRRHRPDGPVGAACARAGRARRPGRSATRAPSSRTATGRGFGTSRSRSRSRVRRSRSLEARATARTSTSATSCTSRAVDGEARASTPSFQHIELHVVGDAARLARGAADEARAASAIRTRSTRVELRAKTRFGERIYISKSLPYFLEFAAPGVTKGAGLDFLAEHLGFTPASTIAFGDGENDVELVEWAGYGVAVENAHPRVKAVADWICPSATGRRRRAGARVLSRLEAMIDLRPHATIPRRHVRRSRGAGRARRSTSCSPPTSAGARSCRRSTSCVRSRSSTASRRPSSSSSSAG